MTEREIRMECLRLAMTLGPSPNIVAMAAEFETFVVGGKRPSVYPTRDKQAGDDA